MNTQVAADRSHGAFERFVREQREELVRFLTGRLPNEQDAQDAAQEAFLRLVRYQHSHAGHAWRPLLYRIAVNITLDRKRLATTHREAGHVSYEDVLFAVPAPQPAPDEHLACQQQLGRLWQAVQALPERTRDVYLLSRVEGMSQAQIATLYGFSVKAVEKHMAKALAALRRRMGEAAASTSWIQRDGK